MKQTTILLSFLILLLGSISFAEGENIYSGNVHNKKMVGVERTFQGELVCLGCDLKKNGARSECKTYGHNIRFKTQNGAYLTILPNMYSDKLLADTSNLHKPITVTGYHFAKANMVDIISYTINGQIFSFCTVHQLMDSCAQKEE